MKASTLIFAMCIASKACLAQLNFHYASGRLFTDPTSGKEIHSPYVAFYQNDEQQWIAYDTNVPEGRFVSSSSTYSSVVACGYIKGQLNLLENRIVTPSDTYTAVAISVNPNQEVQWFYAHNPGVVPSKFHWTQKLRDGMTLLSGHEYLQDEKTAVLLRINREGNLTWTKRIDNAMGLEVRSTMKDRIYWMVYFIDSEEVKIQELDQFTGNVLNEIELTGKNSNEGLRMSKTFYLSESEIIIGRLLKRKSTQIAIDTYSLSGEQISTQSLPYLLDYNSSLELQGVTKRHNGNIQLAFNLDGSIAIGNEEPISTKNNGEILLLTLNGSGGYLGKEKYGSDFAGVNGIYQINDKIAIAGCYEGKLRIQSQKLEFEEDENPRSYLVYLDDFDPISSLELPFDPDIVISELTIFPNPITTQSSITIVNEFIKPELSYEIRLYDNMAKLQSSQFGKTRFESSRDQLNISSLPSGIFHLFVIQDNAVVSQGKFIITR